MNEFHFLRPVWFAVLPPLAFLLWWLRRRQLRSRSWEAVCDRELLPWLLLGRSLRRRNWPLWLMFVGVSLAVVSLAGPAWERQPQPLFRSDAALVVLLDLSRSMAAGDLRPSRLERAKLKLEDLLRQRREGVTALVVFAGEVFVVTPLTEDTATISALLPSLQPELMPVKGSRPDLAIEEGVRLLHQAGLQQGELLLITDDEQPETSQPAAGSVHQTGVRLSVLGVGTPEGAPIPEAGGGFFKDKSGNMVLPRLAEDGLRRLAAAGGGIYRRISVDDRDLRALVEDFGGHEQRGKQGEREGERWREDGIWLLWPLCLLAAASFRRGWLTVLLLFALFPRPVMAMSWNDLWQSPDQQGTREYQDGNFSAAAERFADPAWKGTALFRNGDYDKAAELWSHGELAEDHYNRGNALAKAGRLSEALSAYRKALELSPVHADALHNKQLVEAALRQQQQQGSEGESQPQGGGRQDPGQQDQTGDIPPDRQGETSSSQDVGEAKQEQDRQADQEQGVQSQDQQMEQATQQPGESSDGRQRQDPDEETSRDPAEPAQLRSDAGEHPETEEERAIQQWLQRIPDDPGGLLRRKFLYQSRQRREQGRGEE